MDAKSQPSRAEFSRTFRLKARPNCAMILGLGWEKAMREIDELSCDAGREPRLAALTVDWALWLCALGLASALATSWVVLIAEAVG